MDDSFLCFGALSVNGYFCVVVGIAAHNRRNARSGGRCTFRRTSNMNAYNKFEVVTPPNPNGFHKNGTVVSRVSGGVKNVVYGSKPSARGVGRCGPQVGLEAILYEHTTSK